MHIRPIPSSKLLFPILLSLLVGLSYCKFLQKDKPGNPTGADTTHTTMPTKLMPPGGGDYADAWHIVDSLEQQGLPKSALEKVEAIQATAKKDGNTPQVIKALIYRGKFVTQLEEDGFVKAVPLLETELKTATQPEKAVLQSLLGELYATYLANQGWRISNRTPIPAGEGGDIQTWSADQLERHALELYLASVSETAVLQQTPVEKFRDITTPGIGDTVVTPLRPTLYDLLAHRALGHFANERSFLTEPAYKFELNQPEALAPAAEFVRAIFTSPDSTSGKLLAIKLFQQVIAFHARTNAEPSALIDADLLRLQFVSNTAVFEDRAERYMRALETLHKQYYDHPSDAEIVYAICLQLAQNVSQPGQEGNLQRIVTECKDAIRRHPKTYGASLCAQLAASIRQSTLQMQVEQIYLPERPALVSVNFKNVTQLWVKVVKVSNDQNPLNEVQWEERLPFLNALPSVQTRTWNLADAGDFREHNTEIKLDVLPYGQYYVLIANNAAFDYKQGAVSFASFSVSNLAGLELNGTGNHPQIVVMNRRTGAPQPGVIVDFFKNEWNGSRQRTDHVFIGKTTTNADGLAEVGGGLVRDTYARLNFGQDTLTMKGYFYEMGRSQYVKTRTIQFFTDRSLYRPGQTVYFKGVLLQRTSRELPEIIPGEDVTVKFYDVNGQEKGMLKLKTNEFGTFNGTFTAPATGLTGQMSIRAEKANGGAEFNVEEYKRPKFEVAFKPVEGAYRLEEDVTVHGEAKAFAGSNIDGAQVTYRVVRAVRYPFWNYWSDKMYPPQYASDLEITNGKTVTDANGGFDVQFKAIADPKIPKKNKPQFNYTVYADVTDINGETRSTQTSVSVGYIALQVTFDLPEKIDLEALKKVNLTTTNLAGQPQPASGEITLQRLVQPQAFYTKRYWDAPDTWTMLEADYRRDFPDYAWNEADKPEKWGREDYILPISFNTAKDKTVDLTGGRIQAGYYTVQLKTKDAYGEVVEIQKIVQVWDKKKPLTQFNEPAVALEKESAEPGETARITFGGKPASLHFFYLEERAGKAQDPRWIAVNGTATNDVRIAESDRGGIPFLTVCVYNNRIYERSSRRVEVPWTNKDLTITYETFRDKLAPGQNETWQLKISGPKKEKVAAEMVAAMYDASLDQFLPHHWDKIDFPYNSNIYHWGYQTDFGSEAGESRSTSEPTGEELFQGRNYLQINWFNFPMYGYGRYEYAARAMDTVVTFDPETYEEKVQIVRKPTPGAPQMMMGKVASDELTSNFASGGAADGAPPPPPPAPPAPAPAPPSPLRTNLNETVFFFPELRTDKDGNVIVKFKMNEALTRWKFLAFAHTKDLQSVVSSKEIVTQKDLMILANAPRFFRAGDEMEFSAKVSNLSKEALAGTATLALLDATTLAPVETAFGLATKDRVVNFSVPTGQSTPVSWKIKVPDDYTGAVTWQIFANTKEWRDGEESTLPVVSNRMLVTETLPITVRGNQTKSFTFDNLKNAPTGKDATLKTHRYTLEFTSNPVWYAVQSLPYLMEYPFECSEQIFSRFYANTLASSVTEKKPAIRRVYDRWKQDGTALKSNLDKNQELKYALLEETPWVLDAQDEAKQKQNIALLFDLNRMADERTRAITALRERQSEAGGWPWFPGGRDDWYITQYIVEGFAHLQQLGALDPTKDQSTKYMVDQALGFCNTKMAEQYKRLEQDVRAGRAKFEDDHLDGMAIHYLYTRSFYKNDKAPAFQGYYLDQAAKYWLSRNLYEQGLLALALHRAGRTADAQRIVASLRERAQIKDELGMYWAFDWGMYWYQQPIETQALLVEVFDEVANDKTAVENLRIWLLKNKQTNRWESTKATAEAVYALLLHGDNWLDNTKTVQVSVGGKPLNPQEIEPGTGYFKQAWGESDVKKSWSDIKVENPNSNIVWGAAYWQYFEDLDKIKTFNKTPLTIVKQLFLEQNSPTGPILKPIAEGTALHRGDKIKVRIEIRVDRPMEYVHLKDMRAAGLEPTNVLSQYKWQGGLGYYESTKDLATHFFIDNLPRGTFVFEYPLVVSQKGNMSNGITTMQCMYAPEFTTHSQGVRIKVE